MISKIIKYTIQNKLYIKYIKSIFISLNIIIKKIILIKLYKFIKLNILKINKNIMYYLIYIFIIFKFNYKYGKIFNSSLL